MTLHTEQCGCCGQRYPPQDIRQPDGKYLCLHCETLLKGYSGIRKPPGEFNDYEAAIKDLYRRID